MLKHFLLSTIFLANYILVLGQENDSLLKKHNYNFSIDIGALRTPVLSKNFYGLYISVKYYPLKRYATGIDLSFSEKKIIDTFSYSIKKPLLDFYEFSWTNQFDFIQSKRIRMGLNVNNGLAVARLGDNSIKETYYTEYGPEEKPKKVAANYFYLLEPGMDLSIKLFHIKRFSDFYLTSKAKYRFLFGNCKFAQLSDFSGYYFGLGVSLIGF